MARYLEDLCGLWFPYERQAQCGIFDISNILTDNMQLAGDPITTAIKLSGYKEMGGATSHACQSGAPSISIDWTVRCDWLQVASSCIICTCTILC